MRMWWNSGLGVTTSAIIALLVSDAHPSDGLPYPPGTTAEVVLSEKSGRRTVAAFLSALIPGIGQLRLGQTRKGLALIVALTLLLMINWPIRAPKAYVGYILPVFMFATLFVYAPCDALLSFSPANVHRPKKWWLFLLVPLSLFCAVLLDVASLYGAGFGTLKVNSSAMQTTVMQGDTIVVDYRYYRLHSPSHGDLVLVRKGNYLAVKRIIAVGGDTIFEKNRQVLLNGKPLDEPYIEHIQESGNAPELDNFGPISVPSGSYFVMGDNRDVSLDSRTSSFGLIVPRSVAGRPLYSVSSGRSGKKLQ